MKANLDFERILRVVNELHVESREAANKTGPITEDDIVAMRLFSLFDKDPQYRAMLLQLALAVQIIPQECFACLIALGYRMGQEDAKRREKLQRKKKMPIKKFAKDNLKECLWGGKGPLIVEEDKITDTGRWSIHHLLTFKEKESGKYYQVTYFRGEVERPFDYDAAEIDCLEVRKVQKIVDVWEEVDG